MLQLIHFLQDFIFIPELCVDSLETSISEQEINIEYLWVISSFSNTDSYIGLIYHYFFIPIYGYNAIIVSDLLSYITPFFFYTHIYDLFIISDLFLY